MPVRLRAISHAPPPPWSMLTVLYADGPNTAGSSARQVATREVDGAATEASAADSETERLDNAYKAIFESHRSDYCGAFPPLNDVTDQQKKSGLKRELLERCARRYTASRRMYRDRLRLIDHTSRPSPSSPQLMWRRMC